MCRETRGREPWRVDIYKDVWRRGGNSCRRTIKRHPQQLNLSGCLHGPRGSGWRGAEMSGECCHLRTPGKDSGLYHS